MLHLYASVRNRLNEVNLPTPSGAAISGAHLDSDEDHEEADDGGLALVKLRADDTLGDDTRGYCGGKRECTAEASLPRPRISMWQCWVDHRRQCLFYSQRCEPHAVGRAGRSAAVFLTEVTDVAGLQTIKTMEEGWTPHPHHYCGSA